MHYAYQAMLFVNFIVEILISFNSVDIHLKLQQIEADIEGAGTVHLSSSICEVNKVANQAFGPLFERQVYMWKQDVCTISIFSQDPQS